MDTELLEIQRRFSSGRFLSDAACALPTKQGVHEENAMTWGRCVRFFPSMQVAALVSGSLLMAAVPASASTIGWTDWTSATVDNTSGSAAGMISELGIAVSYTGEVQQLVTNYPSWTPSSSYVGGTIDNAPPQSDNIIRLFGATGATDTITFSSPVVNPVMAIWSLGQGGIEARFVFNSSEPFNIEAGGPSAEFGGSSIYICGDNSDAICGAEGNGTVQFSGTYSSITWTNPVLENWYGFTVGGPVPEPSSLLLMGTGLLALVGAARRLRFA